VGALLTTSALHLHCGSGDVREELFVELGVTSDYADLSVAFEYDAACRLPSTDTGQPQCLTQIVFADSSPVHCGSVAYTVAHQQDRRTIKQCSNSPTAAQGPESALHGERHRKRYDTGSEADSGQMHQVRGGPRSHAA
jgi:hypothetical protein